MRSGGGGWKRGMETGGGDDSETRPVTRKTKNRRLVPVLASPRNKDENHNIFTQLLFDTMYSMVNYLHRPGSVAAKRAMNR